MRKILPLTEEEKRIAEEHHNMVYVFLGSRHYPIEEYYDIAIMGFLAGVQDWCRVEGLKERYAISTICIRNMHNAIATHFRDENAQKRKPKGGFVSLDMTSDEGNETFINSIITPTLEDEYFDRYDREHADGERIKELLQPLTEIQRTIAILLASGRDTAYIAKKTKLTQPKIRSEIRKMRNGKNCTAQEKPVTPQTPIDEYIGVPTDILLTIKLSARQLDVLNLLMVGHTESDIGRRLGISRQAVYDAVKKIRLKAEAVR